MIRYEKKAGARNFRYHDIAQIGDFTFVYNSDNKAINEIANTRATNIICSDNIRGQVFSLPNEILSGKQFFFYADNRIKLEFWRRYKETCIPINVEYVHATVFGDHIHPTAVIEKGAIISPNSFIGANCYIGRNVVIEKNVIIKPNAVIGCDAFSYTEIEGKKHRTPHFGGVVIEDGSDIGSCTCIDDGLYGTTRIGRGSKIDNLCHIAHDVVIGKHCYVIAGAMIAGRVKIGDYSKVAPQASVLNGVTIGENSVIGIHSLVLKDVPDNTVVKGVPAK